MSLKGLLGLESCPLTEEEVIKALQNASNKQLDEIEFPSKNQVKVRIAKVNPKGTMNGHFGYYDDHRHS